MELKALIQCDMKVVIFPGRILPVWFVLALPLTLKDPLPNILRAVGGI